MLLNAFFKLCLIDWERFVMALRGGFHNQQFQRLLALKHENLKSDSETDNPEYFSVTIQAKAMKSHPDLTRAPVASIDVYAVDAAAE